MSSTETPKCAVENCNKPRKLEKKTGHVASSFCTTHAGKATITAFLNKMYRDMRARVNGTKKGTKAKKFEHLYKGKPIMPKDVFMQWAKNHPDFLSLYKQYVMSDFERSLAPSLNRMNSKKGYTLDNVEWMTTGQNCGLAGTVIKMKNAERKVIYEVLGVK